MITCFRSLGDTNHPIMKTTSFPGIVGGIVLLILSIATLYGLVALFPGLPRSITTHLPGRGMIATPGCSMLIRLFCVLPWPGSGIASKAGFRGN